MLSFLHRWNCCWKCQFDTDVKTENYNHHDGEQWHFFKKVHIKTQSKKNVLVIFSYIIALKPFILLQEAKNFNLFDKNCTQEKPQENVIQHEENWLGWIVIEQEVAAT